jgi:hypothetical protein
MNIRVLDGRTVGIVFVAESERGAPEAAFATGCARVTGDSLWVVFADGTPAFHVEQRWWNRIEKSDPEDRAELGADYYLMLYVGPLPEGSGPPEFHPLGLRWPRAYEE